MLCFLNSFARQKFFIALETKSFLKLVKKSVFTALTNCEVSGCKNCKRSSFRCYSKNKIKDEIIKSSNQRSEDSANTIKTVKEATKTITYSGIIVLGLGIAGIIFYTILRELFSGNSASNVYSKALERCLKNDKVVLSLGEPIKAFGEENARGRRHHTNHLLYSKEGINYLRMKFFIKGSRKKATVHLEMKENEKRNFEYRYLFVQLDEYPYTTIVLEDNRNENASSIQPATTESIELS